MLDLSDSARIEVFVSLLGDKLSERLRAEAVALASAEGDSIR